MFSQKDFSVFFNLCSLRANLRSKKTLIMFALWLRSSLIAGLDCGLDRWTGLLDWIITLTFEVKLCVSHDLHPIRRAELGHMFNA